MTKIAEIRERLIGREIDIYDGFSGQSPVIKINMIKFHNRRFYEIYGVNRWGKTEIGTIYPEDMENVLKDGQSKSYYELDHCNIVRRYKLIK